MSVKQYSYLLMTLDPVHIGTGGYRLGRVDNSIAREPGTKLPKIPGTSLNGAIRSYAAYKYGRPKCAGQKGHCGKATCPICYTFGFVSGEGEEQQAYAGTINIFDAQIAFFPVWTMEGPVWVTTNGILDGFKFKISTLPELGDEGFVSSFKRDKALNFGWIMLEPKNNAASGFSFQDDCPWKSKLKDLKEWKTIENKIAIVSPEILSRIVNDNLEVRTSVSINPETGAAESGALFTYEAIPRATFLVLEIVEDNYREAFPSNGNLRKWKDNPEGYCTKAYRDWDKKDGKQKEDIKVQIKSKAEEEIKHRQVKGIPDTDFNSIENVLKSGLSMLEYLSVGGMGTRGFGRIRKVGEINGAI
jgi:CRISPR-associated protein Cmr4